MEKVQRNNIVDKKLIEKYLRLYPFIDNEIKKLESDLSFYENKRNEYSNRNLPEEVRKDMLSSIESCIAQKCSEIQEYIKIKAAISTAIANMDINQRKIIELRFWNGKSSLTEWRDIARALSYHRKTVERIYSRIIKGINVS